MVVGDERTNESERSKGAAAPGWFVRDQNDFSTKAYSEAREDECNFLSRGGVQW